MKKLIALKGCSFACIYFVVTIENFEFKILIAQLKFLIRIKLLISHSVHVYAYTHENVYEL